MMTAMNSLTVVSVLKMPPCVVVTVTLIFTAPGVFGRICKLHGFMHMLLSENGKEDVWAEVGKPCIFVKIVCTMARYMSMTEITRPMTAGRK